MAPPSPSTTRGAGSDGRPDASSGASSGATTGAEGRGRDTRRLALVAVVAAVAVLVAAAGWLSVRRSSTVAAPAPEVVERGPGPSDDVVLVGDSITELSQPTLEASLGDPYRLWFRARGGYRVDQLEPYVVEVAAGHPEQVVINLGTNDVLQGWPTASSVSALTRLLDEVGDVRCVHVVTVNESLPSGAATGGVDVVASARAYNQAVRELAAQRGMDVVDWAGALASAAAAGEPDGPLTTDGIHPAEAGQRLLARLYRDALDRCPR